MDSGHTEIFVYNMMNTRGKLKIVHCAIVFGYLKSNVQYLVLLLLMRYLNVVVV